MNCLHCSFALRDRNENFKSFLGWSGCWFVAYRDVYVFDHCVLDVPLALWFYVMWKSLYFEVLDCCITEEDWILRRCWLSHYVAKFELKLSIYALPLAFRILSCWTVALCEKATHFKVRDCRTVWWRLDFEVFFGWHWCRLFICGFVALLEELYFEISVVGFIVDLLKYGQSIYAIGNSTVLLNRTLLFQPFGMWSALNFSCRILAFCNQWPYSNVLYCLGCYCSVIVFHSKLRVSPWFVSSLVQTWTLDFWHFCTVDQGTNAFCSLVENKC